MENVKGMKFVKIAESDKFFRCIQCMQLKNPALQRGHQHVCKDCMEKVPKGLIYGISEIKSKRSVKPNDVNQDIIEILKKAKEPKSIYFIINELSIKGYDITDKMGRYRADLLVEIGDLEKIEGHNDLFSIKNSNNVKNYPSEESKSIKFKIIEIVKNSKQPLSVRSIINNLADSGITKITERTVRTSVKKFTDEGIFLKESLRPALYSVKEKT